jgi:acetoin utilization protein AcuB
MIAKDLLNDAIPPLKMSDSASKALSWMDEFRVSHLPVVEGKKYLGLISEEDILNMNEPKKPMSKHHVNLSRPYIREDQHVYEAIKMFAGLKLTVLPVLTDNEEYAGILTTTELLNALSSIAAIDGAGSILVIELNVKDYSLSEIARIVESNNGKIISLYLTSHADSNKMELTLKIDQLDLSRIIAAFNRFNYNIKSSFHQSTQTEELRSRFESLMQYLKD